jgi:hypothetical protein
MWITALPPYPPNPTEPGITTDSASIAATAASTALPPSRNISSPASAPREWPVAMAAEFAMIWGIRIVFE